MCKSLNRRNKILIILGILVVLVVAANLGMNFLKKKVGWKGEIYDFFSNIQWDSPYSVKTANPFEDLKLNPFK